MNNHKENVTYTVLVAYFILMLAKTLFLYLFWGFFVSDIFDVERITLAQSLACIVFWNLFFMNRGFSAGD